MHNSAMVKGDGIKDVDNGRLPRSSTGKGFSCRSSHGSPEAFVCFCFRESLSFFDFSFAFVVRSRRLCVLHSCGFSPLEVMGISSILPLLWTLLFFYWKVG